MAAIEPMIIAPDTTEYPFISLKGYVQTMDQTVEEITRPGVDGHGFRLMGKKSRLARLVGMRDEANGPSAEVTRIALRNLIGKVVTVQDDFGNEFDDVIILGVERVNEKPLAAYVGGVNSGSTVVQWLGIDVRRTGIPA